MLIAMAGPPGAGKSTLARELSTRLRGVVLDKDLVRAALFPPGYIEYSTEQDDLCVSIMLQVAGHLLRRHPGLHVFLDGRTFSRRYQVEQLDRWARELGVEPRIVECVCSEETARRRLEGDAREGRHLAGNRDFGLYLSVRARFEPIREPKLVLDTDRPLAECAAVCLDYLTTGADGYTNSA